MKTKIMSTVVGLLIVLTGCASSSSGVDPIENSDPGSEETSTSADADFAIQTVKERFEVDCFAGLGDETSYRYDENSGGTLREGFVYASVGGNILQFSVGLNENTGSFITLPSDDLTVELLESVGC